MIKAVIGSWLGRGILAGSCPRLPRGLSVKTHSPGVGASAQGDAGYSSYMAACPRLSLLLSLLILERAWGHSRQEKGAGRSLRLDATRRMRDILVCIVVQDMTKRGLGLGAWMTAREQTTYTNSPSSLSWW